MHRNILRKMLEYFKKYNYATTASIWQDPCVVASIYINSQVNVSTMPNRTVMIMKFWEQIG